MSSRISRRFGSEAPVIRRLLLLLTLATLGACGSDASTSPNADAIEGTYSLRTVNGLALPFTIQSGANSVTLSSDVITIASNGTWTEAITYRQTINGQTTNGTEADGGSWVRAGSNVTLRSAQDGSTAYSGTFGNGTLTFTDDGVIVVFSR
ncbi:MAG: hypothetical protein ABIP93_19525 [Gemmatimonadaceae bacterium]